MPLTKHFVRFRFGLLFAFLLISIVFAPYSEVPGFGYYAFRTVGSIIVLLTVWAVMLRRSLMVLVVALAMPSILQRLVLHAGSAGMLPLLLRVLSTSFDVLVIAILLHHIFNTERVNAETIFEALCVYLLLGYAFANVYAAVSAQVPHAFYLDPAVNMHTRPEQFDFLYFSFGTLTELGTSGITALAGVSRSVSLLEAIVGILYIAVLISRLVNGYRVERVSEKL